MILTATVPVDTEIKEYFFRENIVCIKIDHNFYDAHIPVLRQEFGGRYQHVTRVEIDRSEISKEGLQQLLFLPVKAIKVQGRWRNELQLVANAIIHPMSPLTCVELYPFNPDDDSYHQFCAALQSPACHLKSLELSDFLTDEMDREVEPPRLLTFLKAIEFSSLTHLTIHICRLFTPFLWKVFANSIAVNRTLQTVWLWKCKMTDEGIKHLCEGLSKNTTLRGIDVADNWITLVGMNHVIELMQTNTTLEEFNLRLGTYQDQVLENYLTRNQMMRKKRLALPTMSHLFWHRLSRNMII